MLIFDEVITGFGRLGADWAANRFDVLPDILTCAKGLTNGCVPMGAVLVKPAIHDAFMAAAPAHAIEFPHGYTYSGHPLAAAAALATLKLYEDEQLFARAASVQDGFMDAALSLQSASGVKDVRTLGLVAGIELTPWADKPAGARGYAVFQACWERGVMVRFTGDTIAVSPPLIIEPAQIAQLFAVVAEAVEVNR